MVSKEIKTLISKEIDGTITSEEKEMLHRHLAENPEATEDYEVQIRMAKLLDDIPPVDPPEDLKNRIMNAIDVSRYSQEQKSAVVFERRAPKISLKWAFAFCLGIIVGFLVHMAFKTDSLNRQWTDSKDFIGTIGRYERGHFSVVERTPFEMPGMSGQLILSLLKDFISCEVQLLSGDLSETEVRFDSARVNFYGFEPYRVTLGVLENGGDFIRIKSSDEARYVLFFKRESDETIPLEITVFQMGRALYRREIVLAPSNE